MSIATEVDFGKVEALAGQIVGMMTGGAVCAGIVLGDQLGLYRSLAASGATQSDDLASATACNPRLTREWLDGQAAAGLIGYDSASDRYSLSAEAAMVLADEDSPAFLAGGTAMFQAIFDAVPKLVSAFKGDGGVGWAEHHPALYTATARFFRPGYRTNLIAEWIPALDGVADKLTQGGTIADVGCGFGHSLHGAGRSVSQRLGSRLRLPRTIDPSRPVQRGKARSGRPGAVRGGVVHGVRRQLRPDLLLRLPARHG